MASSLEDLRNETRNLLNRIRSVTAPRIRVGGRYVLVRDVSQTLEDLEALLEDPIDARAEKDANLGGVDPIDMLGNLVDHFQNFEEVDLASIPTSKASAVRLLEELQKVTEETIEIDGEQVPVRYAILLLEDSLADGGNTAEKDDIMQEMCWLLRAKLLPIEFGSASSTVNHNKNEDREATDEAFHNYAVRALKAVQDARIDPYRLTDSAMDQQLLINDYKAAISLLNVSVPGKPDAVVQDRIMANMERLAKQYRDEIARVGREVQPLSTFHSKRQPPVNQRLQQAYNFLADEDLHRRLDFETFLAELEEWTVYLESPQFTIERARNKTPGADAKLLADVKQMIEVHKYRNEKATGITPISFDFPRTTKTNRLLRAPNEPNQGLVTQEWSGLQESKIFDRARGWAVPASLTVLLTAKETPVDPDSFGYTKKLALYYQAEQIAADNERAQGINQHLNDASFFPSPENFNGPYLKRGEFEVRDRIWKRIGYLTGIAQKLSSAYVLAPRNLLETVIRNVAIGLRADSLAVLPQNVGEKVTPAELDQLLILARPSQPPWGQEVKPAVTIDPSHPLLSDADYHDDLVAFTDAIEDSFTWGPDWWPHPDTSVQLSFILREIHSQRDGHVGWSANQGLDFIRRMAMAGRVRILEEGGRCLLQQPAKTLHPEASIDGVDFDTLGLRLGCTISTLTRRLRDGIWNPEGEQATEATRLRRILSNPEERAVRLLNITIVNLAEPLHGGNDPRTLTDVLAARLLQEQIIKESNLNWDTRVPVDYGETWAFAQGERQPEMKWFDLRRYPLQLQTRARQQEIRSSGPKRLPLPKPKQITDEDVEDENFWATHALELFTDEEKVRHFPGEPYFPFGETPFQQEALSRQFDEYMQDVPEFSHIYNDKNKKKRKAEENIDFFALPNLPKDWNPEYPASVKVRKTTSRPSPSRPKTREQQPVQNETVTAPTISLPYIEGANPGVPTTAPLRETNFDSKDLLAQCHRPGSCAVLTADGRPCGQYWLTMTVAEAEEHEHAHWLNGESGPPPIETFGRSSRSASRF